MIDDLASIISQIESGGDRMAERFEQRVYDHATGPAALAVIDRIAQLNACDGETARRIYATSYGVFQFMGMTLYGLGYQAPLAMFQCSLDDQAALFERFVRQHGILYPLDELRRNHDARVTFAMHYNGPGDVEAYAARILAEIERRDTEAKAAS